MPCVQVTWSTGYKAACCFIIARLACGLMTSVVNNLPAHVWLCSDLGVSIYSLTNYCRKSLCHYNAQCWLLFLCFCRYVYTVIKRSFMVETLSIKKILRTRSTTKQCPGPLKLRSRDLLQKFPISNQTFERSELLLLAHSTNIKHCTAMHGKNCIKAAADWPITLLDRSNVWLGMGIFWRRSRDLSFKSIMFQSYPWL